MKTVNITKYRLIRHDGEIDVADILTLTWANRCRTIVNAKCDYDSDVTVESYIVSIELHDYFLEIFNMYTLNKYDSFNELYLRLTSVNLDEFKKYVESIGVATRQLDEMITL